MDDRSSPVSPTPERRQRRRVDPLLMMTLGLGVFFLVVLSAMILG
jgi:hypothetical protein